MPKKTATGLLEPGQPGGEPRLNDPFIHALLANHFPPRYPRSSSGRVAANDGFTHSLLAHFLGPTPEEIAESSASQ